MDVKARLKSALLSLEDRDLSSQGNFALKLIIDKLQNVQQAGLVVRELVSGLDKCGRSAANNRVLLLSHLLATQGQLSPVRALPQAMPSLVAYIQRQHHSTNLDELATLGSRIGQALSSALAADAGANPTLRPSTADGFGASGRDERDWGDTRQLPDRHRSSLAAGEAAPDWGGAAGGDGAPLFSVDPTWALNHVLLPLLRVACRGPEREAMAAACTVLVPLVEALGRGARRGRGGRGAAAPDSPAAQVLGRVLGWTFTLLGSAATPLKGAGVLQLLAACVQVLGQALDADTAKRMLLAATSGLDCTDDWQVRREAANLITTLAALATEDELGAASQSLFGDGGQGGLEGISAAVWMAGPHRREFLLQALEPIRHDKFPAVRAAFQAAAATVSRLPAAFPAADEEPAGSPDFVGQPSDADRPGPGFRSAGLRPQPRPSGDNDDPYDNVRCDDHERPRSRGAAAGPHSARGGARAGRAEEDWREDTRAQRQRAGDELEDSLPGEPSDPWVGDYEPSFSQPRSVGGTRSASQQGTGRLRDPQQPSGTRDHGQGSYRATATQPRNMVGEPDADVDEEDYGSAGTGGVGLTGGRGRSQAAGRSSRSDANARRLRDLLAALYGDEAAGYGHAHDNEDDSVEADQYHRYEAYGGAGGGGGGPGRPHAGNRGGRSATATTVPTAAAGGAEWGGRRERRGTSGADAGRWQRAPADDWADLDEDADTPALVPSKSPRMGSAVRGSRVAEPARPRAPAATRPGAAAPLSRAPPYHPPAAKATGASAARRHVSPTPRLRQPPQPQPPTLVQPPWRCPSRGPSPRRARSESPGGEGADPSAAAPGAAPAGAAAGSAPGAVGSPRREAEPGTRQVPGGGPASGRERQAHDRTVGDDGRGTRDRDEGGVPGPANRGSAAVVWAVGAAPSPAGFTGASARPRGASVGDAAGRRSQAGSRADGAVEVRVVGAAAASGSAFAAPSPGRRFQRQDASRVSLSLPAGYRPPRASPRFRRPSAPIPQPDFGVQIFVKEPPRAPSPPPPPLPSQHHQHQYQHPSGSLEGPGAGPGPAGAPYYQVNVRAGGEDMAALVAVAGPPVGANASQARGLADAFHHTQLDYRPAGYAGDGRQQQLPAAAAAAALAAASAAAAASGADAGQPLHMRARVHLVAGERAPPPPELPGQQEGGLQVPGGPYALFPPPPPHGGHWRLTSAGGGGGSGGVAGQAILAHGSGPDDLWSSQEGTLASGSVGGGEGGPAWGGPRTGLRRGSAALEHQLQALVEQAQALQASLAHLGRKGPGAAARRQRRRWDTPGSEPWGAMAPLAAADEGAPRHGVAAASAGRHPASPPSLAHDATSAAVQQLQQLLHQAAGAQASLQLLLAGAGTPAALHSAVGRLEELVTALQGQGSRDAGGPGPAPRDGPSTGFPGQEVGRPDDRPSVPELGQDPAGAIRELIQQVEATREKLSQASAAAQPGGPPSGPGPGLGDPAPPGLLFYDPARDPRALRRTSSRSLAPSLGSSVVQMNTNQWSVPPVPGRRSVTNDDDGAQAAPGGTAAATAGAPAATLTSAPVTAAAVMGATPVVHGDGKDIMQSGRAPPREAWGTAAIDAGGRVPHGSPRVRFKLSAEHEGGVGARASSGPESAAVMGTAGRPDGLAGQRNRYDSGASSGGGEPDTGGSSMSRGLPPASGGDGAAATIGSYGNQRPHGYTSQRDGYVSPTSLRQRHRSMDTWREEDGGYGERQLVPSQDSRRVGSPRWGPDPRPLTAQGPDGSASPYQPNRGTDAASVAQRHTGSPRAGGPYGRPAEEYGVSGLGLASTLTASPRRDGGGSEFSVGGDSEVHGAHPLSRVIDFRPLLPAATLQPRVVPAGRRADASRAAGGDAALTALARGPPHRSASPITDAMMRLHSLGAALAPFEQAPVRGSPLYRDEEEQEEDFGVATSPMSLGPTLPDQPRQTLPVYPLVVVPRQPRYPSAAAAGPAGAAPTAVGPQHPDPMFPQPGMYGTARGRGWAQDRPPPDPMSTPSVTTVLASEQSHLTVSVNARSPQAFAVPSARSGTPAPAAATAAAAAAAASARLAAPNVADTATSRPTRLPVRGSHAPPPPPPALRAPGAAMPASGTSASRSPRSTSPPHRLATSSGPSAPALPPHPATVHEHGSSVGSVAAARTPRAACSPPGPAGAFSPVAATTDSRLRSLSGTGVAPGGGPTAALTLAGEAVHDSYGPGVLSSLELAVREPLVLSIIATGAEGSQASDGGRATSGGGQSVDTARPPGLLASPQRHGGVATDGSSAPRGTFGTQEGGILARPSSQRQQAREGSHLSGPLTGLQGQGSEQRAGLGGQDAASPRGQGSPELTSRSGSVRSGRGEEAPEGHLRGTARGSQVLASSGDAAGLAAIRGSTGDLVAIASVVDLDPGGQRATDAPMMTRAASGPVDAANADLQDGGDDESLYALPTVNLNFTLHSPTADADLAALFPATAAAVARQQDGAADGSPQRATREDSPGVRTSYGAFGAMPTPGPPLRPDSRGPPQEARAWPPPGAAAWPPLLESAEPAGPVAPRQLAGLMRPENLQALRDSATGLARSSIEAVREVEELVVRLTMLQQHLAQSRRSMTAPLMNRQGPGRGAEPVHPDDDEVFELPVLGQ